MKICPACASQNRDTARFSQNCASPLAAELVCASCHTSSLPNARFCLNCVAPLRRQTLVSGLTGQLPPNLLLANRYLILRKLGRGGMGAVCLVSAQRLTDKPWALKEMSDAVLVDPAEKQQAVEAFRREATLLAVLNHPNLTRLVDYFTEGGKHYLMLDYVDGQSLDGLLDGQAAPFPEAQVLHWPTQLCDVLGYLHSHTPLMIFRNLKPGNVMADKNGTLRLIDFGVVWLFKTGKSKDSMSFGTTGYAPPEQYGKGQTDARSDVYALGATLHQLLTLRDPANDPFKFPPLWALNASVSTGMSAMIAKALEQDRQQRWRSVDELRQALWTPISTVALPLNPVPATPASPSAAAAAGPASPTSSRLCPTCGTRVGSAANSCLVCGADLTTPSVVNQPPRQTFWQVLFGPSTPTLKRSGFWGYVVVVAWVTITGLVGFGAFQLSAAVMLGIVVFLGLLAAVITKRPLASLLPMLVLPTYYWPSGAVMEVFFLFTGYRRYSLWSVITASILGGGVNLLVILAVFHGGKSSEYILAGGLNTAIYCAAATVAAFVIGKLLRRV